MSYNNTRTKAPYILLFFTFLLFTIVFSANATELTLAHKATDSTVIIEVSLDKVEKLAGMKLAFDYPKNTYQIKDTKKSSNLNSFMHVVNDKTPGRLIIVVASAKGVSGSKFKLFDLTFSRVKADAPESLILKPTECQLMNESLQTIPCTTSPLTVSIQ